jgi:hypothetical protein
MSETTTTPRRVYRTAQIKPRTRDALMDVLAQAANRSIEQTLAIEFWQEEAETDFRRAAKMLRTGRIAMWAAMVFGACIGWIAAWALR